MNFINFYQNKIIKYDIINKYMLKTIDCLPRLKSITITSTFKLTEAKKIISYMLNVELLTLNTMQFNSELNCKYENGNYIYNYTFKSKKVELFLLKYLWLYYPQFSKLSKNVSVNNRRKSKLRSNLCITMASKNFKDLEKFVHLDNKNLMQININLYGADSLINQKSFYFKSLKCLK